MPNLAPYAKAVTAVIGFVLTLLAAGVIPENVAPWINATVAAATVLGVYLVPNAPKDSTNL